MDFKFAFWGTPEVGSKTLEILKNSGYIPKIIITSPDKPQGRKLVITPPPVKVWAESNNIQCLQPEELTEDLIDRLRQEDCDLFIVVAYGKIMPEKLINLPRLGSINIHYSLLPKLRGASPVESAILNGDTETGVTIQQIALKMDQGPIISQEIINISKDEKTEELKNKLITIGGNLLVSTLPKITAGQYEKMEQDENQATYSKKIRKEDGLVNLEKETNENLYNKFRAYHVWPRTFFFKDNKRIIITDAKLEDGKFQILKVLPEGKKEVKFEDFNRATS
ncbi:MAG: Methionyl-tRNA formyltransferase [Patescibacteria group bacterium]|nr:Methionyl-tRNA formyltransferase [Patescibacteria group bacterium]